MACFEIHSLKNWPFWSFLPRPPFYLYCSTAVKTFLFVKTPFIICKLTWIHICFEMHFFWVYNQKSKTPSDGTCLGEPLGGFCYVSFIFILLFFICRCSLFTFSFRHHPSPFRGLSLGFYTHFVHSAQPIAEWSATISLSTIPLSSYREHYGFEWAFFTLCSFLTFLAQPAFIKASLGTGSYSLKFAGLHTDPQTQTNPSVCLIYSNPQSFIHLKFVFIHSILQKFYLW